MLIVQNLRNRDLWSSTCTTSENNFQILASAHLKFQWLQTGFEILFVNLAEALAARVMCVTELSIPEGVKGSELRFSK